MASSSDSTSGKNTKYRCMTAEEACQMILFDSESDNDILDLDLDEEN